MTTMTGEKLPPLPKKAHLTTRASSGEDMASTENREDEPLLLKELTPAVTSDDLKAMLKDVSNVSPMYSPRQGDSDKTPYGQGKQPKISEYSTFVETNPSWRGRSSPSDAAIKDSEINVFTKTDLLPAQSSGPNLNEEKLYTATDATVLIKSDGESESHAKLETETIELRPMGSTASNSPCMNVISMPRSFSSNECSQSQQERQRRHLNLLQQNQTSQHHQGQHQQQSNDARRRTPLSRSQSHPLTTDEAEYSQYWRGQVTVINTPGAALPEVQLKSETALDMAMMSSPITKAIVQGNNTLVLESLRQGENAHLICTRTGRSYLHVICSTATPDHELNWVPMIYQLSNAGIDINKKDSVGRTAARIAIMRRLVQVLAALLKCGAEIDAGDEYYIEQVRGVAKSEMLEVVRRLTPCYWSAVHDLTPFKVKRLIQAWSRVNISRNGQTLIEYAKQNAQDEAIIRLLLHNEASIELAHAVMAGDADRAKVLLCDGAADLGTCDTSVKTNYFEPFAPLTLFGAAIKFGHSDILSVLKEAPRPKEMGGGKADFETDSSIVKGEEIMGVRSGRHGRTVSKSSSSNSLVGHAFHYGSTNGGSYDVRGSDSVTSMLCTIL